ncbi:DUF1573 domain-containing protein [Telmatocola sphagniphila]|uniref:DUF1573 domain-containing protein n=1 Tax=Telmatocola sphagniphila TaxID=1123043 RepID=A0A8E6B7R5_9BACT|nr:DUF1573 domain-containing protein [Telmatocola sphagniphila]QVL32103.1 DUF1573 domain-containing protein [Telmatocola sphagniphila]
MNSIANLMVVLGGIGLFFAFGPNSLLNGKTDATSQSDSRELVVSKIECKKISDHYEAEVCFENKTQNSVSIIEIIPTCSCASGRIEDSMVDPVREGKIRLEFKPGASDTQQIMILYEGVFGGRYPIVVNLKLGSKS